MLDWLTSQKFVWLGQRMALIAILALASLAAPGSAVAQDWTEFRGPRGTGVLEGAHFPTEIGPEDILWRTPIAGRGWSSPVVWGKQIWLTTADPEGKTMSVVCVDLDTGEVLLDRVLHQNEQPDFVHPTNSYASPTPTIEAGRVYVHFGKYGTTCLDTSSFEVLWQRTDLECDHFRGPASSPILYQDLLIVAFDGADQQYVVAFAKSDGKTVWKTNREIDYGTENGDFKKAYGTGTVFDVDGQPVLVLPSAVATIAYDPRTGKPLWTVYHDGMNVSARPQRTHTGNLLITNGMGQMVAVRPAGEGNITETGIQWRLSKGVARKPTPLVLGQRFYMINDQGVASCYDASTGNPIWQERLKGAFSSSPVFDGHTIFVCSESGVVYALAPGDEFRQLGASELASGFKATPALVGDKMLLRSFEDLICVKARPR